MGILHGPRPASSIDQIITTQSKTSGVLDTSNHKDKRQKITSDQHSTSNPPNISPLHLRPFHFPLISQSRIYRIGHDDRQAKTPDESDGVEEIGVARAGVDPEIVKSGAEESCVEDCGCCEEGVAHYCTKKLVFRGTEYFFMKNKGGEGGKDMVLRGKRCRYIGKRAKYNEVSDILG